MHTNSGIPNHAFYLVATELGGFSWERAGRIWYEALTKRLISTSNFQDAADARLELRGTYLALAAMSRKLCGWMGAAWDQSEYNGSGKEAGEVSDAGSL